MAKSECFCPGHSCESVLDKTETGYVVSTNRRFRFDKEDNVIVNGGVVENDIPTCRKMTGHDLRSVANDPRPHGHKEHWKKVHQM